MRQHTKDLLDRNEIREEIEHFKSFAFKKSLFEVSIAFILGAAFNKVVASVSNNLLMPIINAVLSHTGTTWREFTWQISPGISLEIGQFIGTCVDFLITSAVLYLIYIKLLRPILPGNKKQAPPMPFFIKRRQVREEKI